MKLSAKGRYAIKALVNIATNESSTPKTLLEISKYQGISLSYLEQLFSLLRKHSNIWFEISSIALFILIKNPIFLALNLCDFIFERIKFLLHKIASSNEFV